MIVNDLDYRLKQTRTKYNQLCVVVVLQFITLLSSVDNNYITSTPGLCYSKGGVSLGLQATRELTTPYYHQAQVFVLPSRLPQPPVTHLSDSLPSWTLLTPREKCTLFSLLLSSSTQCKSVGKKNV